MVNFVFGTLLLVFMLAWCVYIAVDIFLEGEFQTAAAEREELLEELWSDE